MSSIVEKTSASRIQKIWRKYCHKQSPTKVRRPIKIYGFQSGDPPLDSEWIHPFDNDTPSESDSNWWGDSLTIIYDNDDPVDEFYPGDEAEFRHEKQFNCR